MAQTHLFDQGRRFIVSNAGAVLDFPGFRAYPVVHSGGGVNDAGGYNWISGFFASDQVFTVDIYQGQTNAALPVHVQYTGVLDAVTLQFVAKIKVPVYTEYVGALLTNTSGFAQTILAGELYLSPVEGSPLTPSSTGGLEVEGTDDDGDLHSNNPIQISGWEPGGTTVRVPSVAVGANNRQLIVKPSDGTHDLGIVSQGVAVESTGIQTLVDYEAVPPAVLTGQAVRLQGTAYGRIEPAAFSRAVGADQTLEVAPVEYDVSSSTLRASAALAAAGAYDVPIEIPTGLRDVLTLLVTYTRAAVGGAYQMRIETALTVSGTDYWSRSAIYNAGVFAAGSDTVNEIQRNADYQYVSTSAVAEPILLTFRDLSRVDKFRVSFREVGIIASPGTLAAYYRVSN